MRHAPLVSLVVSLLALTARPAHASWSPDSIAGGTLVCSDPADQTAPVAISDGAGGSFVAWVDHRGAAGTTDVYAQHMSASGSALWGPGGKPVCTAAGNQDQVAISEFGATGELLIVWRDFRGTTSPGESDLYAQHLDRSGNPVWAANGIALCIAAGNQQTPTVSGTLVVWSDGRGDGDIYGQIVAANGSFTWAANGRGLCTSPGEQRAPALGGATRSDVSFWLAWEDVDAATVMALPFDASLAPHAGWSPQGEPVNPAQLDAQAQATFLAGDNVSDGTARLCWVEGTLIMGGIFDPGQPPQVSNQVVQICGGGWTKSSPRLVRADKYGPQPFLFAAWLDSRNGHANLYAQSFDMSLVRRWNPVNGVAVSSGTITVGAFDVAIQPGASTADTSVALVWMQRSDGSGAPADYKLYAQRIGSTGAALWASGGRRLPGTSLLPAVVAVPVKARVSAYPDLIPRCGTICVWQDDRGAQVDVESDVVDALGQLGDREPRNPAVQAVASNEGFQASVQWTAARDTIPGAPLIGYQVIVLSGGAGGPPTFVPRTGGATYGQNVTVTGPEVPLAVRIEARYQRADGTWAYWFSDTASGRSVDSVPPPVPTFGRATYTAAGTQVNWLQGTWYDLAGNRLYRGSTANFPTDAAHLIVPHAGDSYYDPAAPPSFYKVASFDVHGNESEALLITPSGTTEADAGAPPLVFSVANISPNPLASAGRVEFGLPRRAPVRMSLVDPGGRVVRDWNLGTLPPGKHSQALELSAPGAGALASGVYFLKVTVPGETRTQRVAVIH